MKNKLSVVVLASALVLTMSGCMDKVKDMFGGCTSCESHKTLTHTESQNPITGESEVSDSVESVETSATETSDVDADKE